MTQHCETRDLGLDGLTVEDAIAVLKQYPPDAAIEVYGYQDGQVDVSVSWYREKTEGEIAAEAAMVAKMDRLRKENDAKVLSEIKRRSPELFSSGMFGNAS